MNHTNINLTVSESGQWGLKGELTMMSLSGSWRSLESSRPVKSSWSIDFTGITQMDSAGVAFLLDCIRYAETLKLRLEFLNLSHEVFELIEAQGVMSLIEPYLKVKHGSTRN
ncbi:MAG: hypothetical protein K0S29_357 [Gammaproteobacteria bacterium]|jgi:ABC-type transporter Mla MlaB component|nr:hypothetical protein [Gammaproteobacteria bacterium]